MAERIVASPATGAEVLYRVVSVDGAAIDDFRGRRDLPRTRPLPPDTPWLLLAGVSMFDTPAAALRIAQRRPAGLAHVRLKVDVGIHFARTGRPGALHGLGRPQRARRLRGTGRSGILKR
jgi:hypothetical protein